MENWAIIDSTTNICINVILWDGVSPYTPPPGTFMEPAGDGQIGWVWNGTELVDPNPPPAPEPDVSETDYQPV